MDRAAILLSICVFACPVVSGCVPEVQEIREEPKEAATVTLEAAKEAAMQELETLGYDAAAMDVSADDSNAVWNSHITVSPSVLENEEIKKMHLQEREYWAVYFGRTSPGKGGDAFVFIDRSNGKVVGVLLGE